MKRLMILLGLILLVGCERVGDQESKIEVEESGSDSLNNENETLTDEQAVEIINNELENYLFNEHITDFIVTIREKESGGNYISIVLNSDYLDDDTVAPLVSKKSDEEFQEIYNNTSVCANDFFEFIIKKLENYDKDIYVTVSNIQDGVSMNPPIVMIKWSSGKKHILDYFGEKLIIDLGVDIELIQ